MKYLNVENFSKVLGFLRRYISPAYIMMLVAAFVLWYATKLGDNYTTDHEVTVVVDGVPHTIDCTIRGKGIDLIGYTMSSRRSSFYISSSELTYENEIRAGEGVVLRHLSTVSLQQALAARMSDIEVIAVGSIPPTKSIYTEESVKGAEYKKESVGGGTPTVEHKPQQDDGLDYKGEPIKSKTPSVGGGVKKPGFKTFEQ